MIDPSFSNLTIDCTTETMCINQKKSSFRTSTSCSNQNSKGRMALKAFLLQDSIGSRQLKQELEKSETPSPCKHNTNASRSQTRNVNFNLSKNTVYYLPTLHSKKRNWYSKSDYNAFQEESRECVRSVFQNDPLFDHSQDSNSPVSFPSLMLSSSKQRLLRLYLDSLLSKGGPRNVACSSKNVAVVALLEQGWGESDLLLRGLESYLLPDMKTYRKFYRKHLVQHYNRATMYKNGNKHCSNESELRLLSIKMTKASIKFAYVLGCIDAVCTEKLTVSI
jgi:hypothetical protein